MNPILQGFLCTLAAFAGVGLLFGFVGLVAYAADEWGSKIALSIFLCGAFLASWALIAVVAAGETA